MREMIISELSQALHAMARGFAHFLPRLIVMLIVAIVGWVVAFVAKVVLRSILTVSYTHLCAIRACSRLRTWLSHRCFPKTSSTMGR